MLLFALLVLVFIDLLPALIFSLYMWTSNHIFSICFTRHLYLVYHSFNLLRVYFNDTGVFIQLLYTFEPLCPKILYRTLYNIFVLLQASLLLSTVNSFVKESVAISGLPQKLDSVIEYLPFVQSPLSVNITQFFNQSVSFQKRFIVLRKNLPRLIHCLISINSIKFIVPKKFWKDRWIEVPGILQILYALTDV